MHRFKEGEQVTIIDRPATTADNKSGLYFGFYRNLAGTIFKIYGAGEAAQAAVDIEVESLPEEIVARHYQSRDRMRESLTGEAKRNSGPGGENEFRLRYVILVALADLAPRPAPRRKRIPAEPAIARAAVPARK